MGRWIPVEILEHAGYPVFISDEEGRVEYCNSMAADLVQRDRSDIEGQPCWELMRLRSADGKPLCRPQCAVQRQSRTGKLQGLRSALLRVNGDPAVSLDLYSVPVSPLHGRRCAILHMLKPAPETAPAELPELASYREPAPLELLTRRERQVLEHLANGMGTDAIAGALFLSRATVRNHVRAILSKLGVHTRIEAVLASVAWR